MSRKTVAVAGIPGAWSSEMLARAFAARGAASFVLPLWECAHDLADGSVSWSGVKVPRLDAVVVKKIGDAGTPFIENRLIELKELERNGALVVSSADAIRDAVNRYRMSWMLRRAGIPMPRTLVTESIEEAEEVIHDWGRAVAKPLFTSKGRGMLVLSHRSATRLTLRRWQHSGAGPFYLQEFVRSPGRDVAVATLGDQVLASYYRVAAPGQWQTTTRSGGHYEPCTVPPEVEEVALAAVRVFGLDFSCVDFVETEDGWLVYEVSAFGGFSGLWKAHGIDAAGLYADHVLRRLGDERN